MFQWLEFVLFRRKLWLHRIDRDFGFDSMLGKGVKTFTCTFTVQPSYALSNSNQLQPSRYCTIALRFFCWLDQFFGTVRDFIGLCRNSHSFFTLTHIRLQVPYIPYTPSFFDSIHTLPYCFYTFYFMHDSK